MNTSVFDRQVSVKPRDWHLVKKRGIVPDGRTQSKLKFKVDNESSTLRGGGGIGAPNDYRGVSNVDRRMKISFESESQEGTMDFGSNY